MKRPCERARALWDRSVDGELSDHDRIQVTEHLKTCPNCRAELQGERQLARVLAGLPHLHCPDRVIQNIVTTTGLQNQRTTRIRGLRHLREARALLEAFRRRRVPAGFAALAVVILVSLIFAFGGRRGSLQHSFSDEEILRARKQAGWSLAYVIQTIDGTQGRVLEGILRKDLPQMIDDRIRDAVPTVKGGKR